jgi:two-component sensor histidine kinase
MPWYGIVYLATLIVFTFGALSFSVLALIYWREKRPRAGRPFAAFTVCCAAAFVLNLALPLAGASRLATLLLVARELATGLLPPLLLHVVWRQDRPEGRWRWLVIGFYCAAGTAALGRGLSAAGLIPVVWADRLEPAPAAALGLAAVLGLAVQLGARAAVTPAERNYRRWKRVLLCLMAASAAAATAWSNPLFDLLPDYLLLAFFCVTLYYRERLVFFDLLIKRGAYFAVALISLTVFFAAWPRAGQAAGDATWPWIGALLLTPLWLVGPWIERRLGDAIDRLWLRRRYSAAEGERRFVQEVQAAVSEDDLRARAEQSLAAIFQTRAEVRFAAEPAPETPLDGLTAELQHRGQRLGWVALEARPQSIPFLSDDRRLLQSVARTLAVVLENVRFRDQRAAQEESERQLRLLASRAELKALRAQINPHFLFNALNAIAGLIQEQPQLADETVEQLAQVFRYTLRRSQHEWVRLEEEMEFVTAYLRVEQARFGDRLRVSLHVEADAGSIAIPAMTVQPLLENAIKHGASGVEGSATVTVQARARDGLLVVEVADNGPGFPPDFSLEAAAGHGLRNIAERLKGYYGEAARLRWENTAGGARVVLEIPREAPAEATGRMTRAARTDR